MDLTGQFLIAAPAMQDLRFEESVIYIIEHNDEGATGLVVNRPLGMELKSIFTQFHFKNEGGSSTVLWGGPVAPNQGIVLHTDDKRWERSMLLGNGLCTSVSIDVIEDIAKGEGPKKFLFTLGYAGWSKGQLESEIQREDWLVAPVDNEILFDMPYQMKYDAVLAQLGLAAQQLKSMDGTVGHA